MFMLEENTVLAYVSNRCLSAAVCVLLLSAACAPITPLPTPPSPPMPSPSSSGGSSSGSPPSSSGQSGQSGQSSGQQSGQQGQSSGGSSGGGASGGIPRGGGPPSGGGQEGGSEEGQPGGSEGGEGESGTNNDPLAREGGASAEPTWEVDEGSSGDDGWATSNEIPGTPGSADGTDGNSDGTGGDGQSAGGEGESAGGEGEQEQAGAMDGEDGTPGSGDDELDGALRDFDGEILAERDIIKSNSASGNGSGGIELPIGDEADGASGNAGPEQTGGQIPAPRRAMPPTPAPPRRVSGSVPGDISGARDDDIIARQLREAAMQEEDLDLKEKLWEEYRKYKKG